MFVSTLDIVEAAEAGNINTVTVHNGGPVDRTIVVYCNRHDVFAEVSDIDGTPHFMGQAFNVHHMSRFNKCVDAVLGHNDFIM